MLVKLLCQQADDQEHLNRQCLLLADMLSSQAKHAPMLSEHSRLELAIGSFLTGLQATQHRAVLVHWLVQHIKVQLHAVMAFRTVFVHILWTAIFGLTAFEYILDCSRICEVASSMNIKQVVVLAAWFCLIELN